MQGQIPDVCSVEGDPPVRRIPQARNQVDDGALSAAAGADDGDTVPAVKGEVDVLQDHALPVIGKTDMVEYDFTPGVGQFLRVRLVIDLGFHVIVFENPREHRHGTDPVHLDVQQAVHRPVHPAQQGDENGNVADGDGAVIFHDQDPADQVKQHRPDGGQGIQEHEEPAAGHFFPDVQFDHPSVGFLVALVFMLFPAEELDQQLAADRQGLIQDAVDLVVAFLGFRGKFPASLAGHPGGQGEQRNYGNADQGKDPVFPEHGDQGDHQRDGVGENAGEGAGHDGFHAGNVAGHAGDDIPLVGGSEEPLGHFLQMAVHLVAHIIGNMLRDPVVQIVLADADQV